MTLEHTAGPALRIGIAGSGRMARSHAGAITRLALEARLGAVADPSPKALEEFRLAFPGVATFQSVEDMLAADVVDVVHVVTPPDTHHRIGRQVLEAGRHLYLEKPFTETVAEAEDLLRLAGERGLEVCAGHQLLFERPTVELQRYLPSLRGVSHIESYFSFRTARHAPGGRTPLRPDLQLMDILPHPVYLLLRVLERAGRGAVTLENVTLTEGGTVHALVRRGDVTGVLVVTLTGRPVESYLRVTGPNGSLFADFVRGVTLRAVGPGASGIDKVIAPFRQAWQLWGGTTAALTRRVLNRQRSYPGLVELFSSFYTAIARKGEAPMSGEGILETVRICEQIGRRLAQADTITRASSEVNRATGTGVLITGGTGFLGEAIVRTLVSGGRAVRCVARREPTAWQRIPGVDYATADLSHGADPGLFAGIDTVIHCAAATAGGWEEHQRYSLDATEHMVRAAAQAGVRRFLHVSSVAVLERSRAATRDEDPLQARSRGSGPYVWGKLESERIAVRLGQELGIEVKVVRPGAIVDYGNFDPPGRLGKRIGGVFVAVGSPGHRLGTTELGFAARAIDWMVHHWSEAPALINLLDPESPTKRQLLARLRETNPDLTVVWLPTVVLVPLSWFALGLQKVLRPGKPATNVAKVFATQAYDTSRSATIASKLGPAG